MVNMLHHFSSPCGSVGYTVTLSFLPPHGARGRVRRPHAVLASVLPFGKTTASLPAPARVSAVRRNVPPRSLAAVAASARGGKKPPAGRFCLLVFGRCSSGARVFVVSYVFDPARRDRRKPAARTTGSPDRSKITVDGSGMM